MGVNPQIAWGSTADGELVSTLCLLRIWGQYTIRIAQAHRALLFPLENTRMSCAQITAIRYQTGQTRGECEVLSSPKPAMLTRILNMPFLVILMGIGALAMYIPAIYALLDNDLHVARVFLYGATLF